jgi:multiple sugar transport system ATP-binding protein
MRAQLARLHDRLGVTTVYVTHDQVEAMTLGQRVAVMRDGQLQQVDTPQNLYRSPANLFVAAFMGSPSMNLVDADVADGEVRFADFRIPLPVGGQFPAGSSTVVLGIRPQDFADAGSADPSLPTIEVEITVVEDLGSSTHVIFLINAPSVDAAAVQAASEEPDAAGVLTGDRRTLFTAELGEGIRARVGEKIRLALDPSRFHFFDPATGEAIARP